MEDKNLSQKKKAKLILKAMEEKYGVVECTLDERFDPWRLLVCAILAAQCTDARVNLVSPALLHALKQLRISQAQMPRLSNLI